MCSIMQGYMSGEIDIYIQADPEDRGISMGDDGNEYRYHFGGLALNMNLPVEVAPGIEFEIQHFGLGVQMVLPNGDTIPAPLPEPGQDVYFGEVQYDRTVHGFGFKTVRETKRVALVCRE